MMRIERTTSPLPRECSTTELHELWNQALRRAISAAAAPESKVHAHHAQTRERMRAGAGERNRTVVLSLEGFSSTIELHPHVNFVQNSYCFLSNSLCSSRKPTQTHWRKRRIFLYRRRGGFFEFKPLRNAIEWWRGLDSNQRIRRARFTVWCH
jgi:hypothetical protein